MPIALFPVTARLAAGSVLLLLAGPCAAAQPAGPIGAGNVLQVLLGLLFVLALLAGAAWMLRRVGQVPGLGNRAIKTIGAAAVGTRERVVLLEVSGTWILIGVAPGQVRALATMPRGELEQAVAPVPPGTPFGALLQRFSERRHAS